MKGSDRLKIHVANFGPIVKADVDLRPFTLFVGPSNTGKSYLAILIYALHQRFGQFRVGYPHMQDGPLRFRRFPSFQKRRMPPDKSLPSNDSVDYFLDWAKQVFSEARMAKEGKATSHLPEKIAALIRPLLESDSVSDGFATADIASSFGLQSPADLIRRPGSEKAHIVLRRYVEANKEDEPPFVLRLDISKHEPDLFSGPVHLSVSIPAEKPLFYLGEELISRWIRRAEAIFLEPDLTQKERKRLVRRMIHNLVEVVFSQIIGPIGSPAYYLPAGRTGIIHAQNAFISAMTGRAKHTASSGPMLSGVVADFLEQLLVLRGKPHRKVREMEALTKRIERKILRGSLHFEESVESENYGSITYRPTGWKESLPLMHASSMVSELAPVVLYLRHVVRPGDVLIIEEPEAHLHPGMQVELTRILAAAVRNGIRIIVTTHSEWILEELANLVSASALSKDKQKNLGVADFALEESEVGAWLFQPKKRPKDLNVQEIKLDPESGTFGAGFDEVAATLHNRWADISSYSE